MKPKVTAVKITSSDLSKISKYQLLKYRYKYFEDDKLDKSTKHMKVMLTEEKEEKQK